MGVARAFGSSPLAPSGLIAVFLLILAPRLAFVWLAPTLLGDAHVYVRVAENIFANGCVSLSDPATAACVPDWGGNQLPGYPAFIALAWFFTGHSASAPLLAQCLVFAVAGAYAVWSIGAAGLGRSAQVLAAIVLTASPSLVAWPRLVLTETLAAAAALWVLAAILRSSADGRLRASELGTALAVAIFLRYSLAALIVPVALFAFSLHDARQAPRRMLLVLMIAVVPFAAWTARSISAGLPFPQPILTQSGNPVPAGVLAWMKTWIKSQYDLPISVWPLLTEDYAAIVAPPNAATPLLGELVARGPVQDVDLRFAALAEEIGSRERFRQWVALPLQRSFNLWFSPFPSMGWPAEVGGAARAAILAAADEGRWGDAGAIALLLAPQVGAKALVAAWRYFVAFLALAMIVRAVAGRRLLLMTRAAVWLALIFSIAIAATAFVETRYLVPVLALLEVALAIEMSRVLSPRSGEKVRA